MARYRWPLQDSDWGAWSEAVRKFVIENGIRRSGSGGLLHPRRLHHGGPALDRPRSSVQLLHQHSQVRPQGGQDHLRERQGFSLY